jgi:hypothetical protein
MRTSGLPVRWSAVDKEDAVKLSDENLTASCHCGLPMLLSVNAAQMCALMHARQWHAACELRTRWRPA